MLDGREARREERRVGHDQGGQDCKECSDKPVGRWSEEQEKCRVRSECVTYTTSSSLILPWAVVTILATYAQLLWRVNATSLTEGGQVRSSRLRREGGLGVGRP